MVNLPLSRKTNILITKCKYLNLVKSFDQKIKTLTDIRLIHDCVEISMNTNRWQSITLRKINCKCYMRQAISQVQAF